MNLKDYFDNVKGIGVLSTSNDKGEVDSAIYATPHVFDDTTVGFIMRDRLSYQNITSNPKACYLFVENSLGYNGKRLYLTKVKEEKNSEQLMQLRRRHSDYDPSKENLFLVTFNVDQALPLICKEDLC